MGRLKNKIFRGRLHSNYVRAMRVRISLLDDDVGAFQLWLDFSLGFCPCRVDEDKVSLLELLEDYQFVSPSFCGNLILLRMSRALTI